jgi:hypothetical protein
MEGLYGRSFSSFLTNDGRFPMSISKSLLGVAGLCTMVIIANLALLSGVVWVVCVILAHFGVI